MLIAAFSTLVRFTVAQTGEEKALSFGLSYSLAGVLETGFQPLAVKFRGGGTKGTEIGGNIEKLLTLPRIL